ncbi:hypothetical protein DB347_22780 [Opitutaceae bacterium EW11]|nr:hypothetical protein DB347_22780 [Opitutaceae bacterium EW11]
MARTIFLVSSIFLFAQLSWATPAEDLAHNGRVTDAAVVLFQDGKSADALTYLRTNLRPEPGSGVTTTEVALVQQLAEVSGRFYNQRQLALAQGAAQQALIEAEPILKGTCAVPSPRKASLYSSLGLLSETVLLDLESAQVLYEAAASLEPSDPLNNARKRGVAEKLRRKAGGR